MLFVLNATNVVELGEMMMILQEVTAVGIIMEYEKDWSDVMKVVGAAGVCV